MKQTKEQKRIEKEINAAFSKYSPGNPINIMDIGKVMKAGKDAAAAERDIDAAVKFAIESLSYDAAHHAMTGQ